MSMFCFFFFFKQKTAYEMRISDWSSDVCSSDLTPAGAHAAVRWPRRLGRAQSARRRVRKRAGRPRPAVFDAEDLGGGVRRGVDLTMKIGRASCRERVCQYV